MKTLSSMALRGDVASTSPVIVQKFGGTSLSSDEARHHACRHIVDARKGGLMPVVVVSAMGRDGEPYATDTLASLARDMYPQTGRRELDLLTSCGEIISAVVMGSALQAMGEPAVVLTGGQAGIITDDRFSEARILRVEPRRILAALQGGNIVVVTGFQGVTETGEVATLGRGGSDTTAAALGAALDAEVVEIYTDVDGVKTADPKLVPGARTLDSITYEELAQLAHEGARVMHPRAIEIAMRAGVRMRVRSTFDEKPGTLVANRFELSTWSDLDRRQVVTGIAHFLGRTQVTVEAGSSPGDQEDLLIFDTLATAGINVDHINMHRDRKVFIVREEEAERTAQLLSNLGLEPILRRGCAKISVVGMGMRGVPGVMASVVRALNRAHVEILQTTDSQVTISCLVDEKQVRPALQALANEFELDG